MILKMTCFEVMIFILVSGDYLDIARVVRVPRKVVFASCFNFFGDDFNGWLLGSIY